MAIGTGAKWGVILPVDTVNLANNPSFELGTAGWGTIAGGTIGTTSAFQAFGAWSGSFAPTSNGTSGAYGDSWSAGNGTLYTVSAYVCGANGIPYRLAAGDSNGLNFVGSTTFTGGGTWQRYSFSFTEAVGATRTVVLTKNASANTGAIYIDGVQIEPGALTTYIDGDMPGGTWQGRPHASATNRSGMVRSGGTLIALADLGFLVEESQGIGMPPVEVNAQSYAIQDGAQFQRTRTAARTFTLTASVLGNTWEGLHGLRRQFVNAVKADATTPQQPTRFYYLGAGGTAYIDAVYQSGLEFGEPSGFAEMAAVQFVAHDPYWRSERQSGTSVPGRQSIGSVHNVVQRTPQGVWGTMAGGATTPGGFGVNALAYNAGTLYAGGDTTAFGGTNSPNMAFWLHNASRWGTFGGTANGLVEALVLDPFGTLYMGGQFLGVNGTAGARYLAQYGATGFGSLNAGGTLDSEVTCLDYSPLGTLFAGGAFSKAAGSTARFLVLWSNSAFGTLNGQQGGTVNGVVMSLDYAPSVSRLYFAGSCGSAGGTAIRYVGQWAGAFGSLAGGVGGTAMAVSVGPDGRVYAAGSFPNAGVGSANNIAVYNGVGWSPLGSGILYSGGGGLKAYSLRADPNSGAVTVMGFFDRAGGVPTPDSQAQYFGGAWTSIDVDLPPAAVVNTHLVTPDGALYVAGLFDGTAQAPVTVPIVNAGLAQAYPTIRLRNTGAGTARVYQLVNYTTGDTIFLNLPLAGNETLTVTLDPVRRGLQSDIRGNCFSYVQTGSNLSTWRLLPGTNWFSCFAESGSVQCDVFYTPRHWSADGSA